MSALKSFVCATCSSVVVLILSASVHAASSTNWKFDFGSGAAQSGYVQALPSTGYNSNVGYGFASTAGLSSVNRGAPDALRGDFITRRRGSETAG